MEMIKVMEMVQQYFKENNGLKYYEPIAVLPTKDDYLFRVMAKYIGENSFKQGTYATWTSFNTSTGNLNYGHYDLFYETAYEILVKGEVDRCSITKDRAIELATLFKDQLEERIDDVDESYGLFENDLELSDNEMEFFGIKKPKRYKQVEYEVTIKIPVVMPQDEEEDYFPIDEYVADEVSRNGIDSYYLSTKVLRENLTSDQAKREYECYGSDEID